MKVVILAAGIGRSLYPLTKHRPKALLTVGGTTLLERLLRQVARHGASPVIVVGHGRQHLVDAMRRLPPALTARAEIVDNPLYDRSNTLYSLWRAGARCRGEAFAVVDGDLICDDAIVDAVMTDAREAVLAVDRLRVMGDEEVKVVCDHDGRVTAIGKTLVAGEAHGEFIGLARYGAAAGEELLAILDALARHDNLDAYYEEAIARLSQRREIAVVDVSGRRWAEIDFVSDYAEALRQFGDVERAQALATLPAMRRQLLFCPGPVLVSRRVKRALMTSEVGHREVEFSEVLNRSRLKLGKVFGIQNFHRYTTVILNGSGSAANEALLGTAGVGRRLLVLTNGEFGERLLGVARHLGLDAPTVAARWGEPLDLAAVERALAAGGIGAVAWVHHETSTGMLNPIAPIAALARRYRADTFVDAVSSVGGVPVDVEAHALTFCTGSANKAIGGVPGLSFVCGQRAAFEALAGVRSRSLYLDLYQHFVYNDRLYQTPNTPAVNLFFALEAALDDLLGEGLDRRFRRYRLLARRLRRGFRALGLRAFFPAELMSPLLTTVELPTGFTADDFLERIKREGYVVYAGKGILRDRVFQVANIGALRRRHVDAFLEALGRIMEEPRDDHPGGDPGRGHRLTSSTPH
jgi:2-aminoethylphosphonate-pyruvate transaminase